MPSPSSDRFDVIVIGAGPNGLTAAATLAKRGRKVLVLERRDVIGGLAAREEFHPGFFTPGVLHDAALFDRHVIDDLGLARHGLVLTDSPPSVFAPQRDGPGLLLHHDPDRAHEEIAAHDAGDAERYANYRAFLDSIRPFFGRLLRGAPPDIEHDGWRSQFSLASTGFALRRLGRRTMMQVLRIGPMCAADWLNEWFHADLLKCLLAAPAFDGSLTGPWSPGSNAMLIRNEMLSGPAAPGGPASITAALEAACRRLGAVIRIGADVSRVRVDAGISRGVTLADGETIDAGCVMASCDPLTLFGTLVQSREQPDALAQRIAHFRSVGTLARVNLALSAPLRFACRPDLAVGRARIAETFDEMERACDATKYRRCSETPILDVSVPTITDATLAPEGRHVASIIAHYAPHNIAGGWTDEARASFADRVIDRLSQYAPDVPSSIIAREVLTPVDLERRYGITGGHIHHGEHGLDQMIVRPVPECARYATPIGGLYLCGSGSHPGGGLTGLPGALAARAVAG